MRICLIAEGCYPYVVGGVSSWVHSMIRSFPEHEFVLLAIAANRSLSGRFAYELPANVSQVHELFLEDADWIGLRGPGHRKVKLSAPQYQALRGLLMDHPISWDLLFSFFRDKKPSLNRLLMGEDFYHAVWDCYRLQYPDIVFSDFLWTMRSMYLPLFQTLSMKIPKADIYHAVSTGYAGILGAMGKYFHGGKLLLSEHGIYAREREEELIQAQWVQQLYKGIWIRQFKKLAQTAYQYADVVTSLYPKARELQVEFGCPPEKTCITPNGIDCSRFENLPGVPEKEKGWIHIGAVLRVTPIKDVKTMIQAFSYAKERNPKLKLWIMGPLEEEPVYAQECMQMVSALKLPDVVFTGSVQVTQYLGWMDMTILTSISEGQPLTILESFAAGVPVIATNVGNCGGLLLGEEKLSGVGAAVGETKISRVGDAVGKTKLPEEDAAAEAAKVSGGGAAVGAVKVSRVGDAVGKTKLPEEDAAAGAVKVSGGGAAVGETKISGVGAAVGMTKLPEKDAAAGAVKVSEKDAADEAVKKLGAEDMSETDGFGPAGILTHIMHVQEIAEAMLYLAEHPQLRQQMGQAGRKRLLNKYKVEDMRAAYAALYRSLQPN